MSVHSQGTGPRSNAYSSSKCSNWALYDPFILEAESALKCAGRLPKSPTFPKVIAFSPLTDFIHACTRQEIQMRLRKEPAENLAGLRAVFLLSGTRKQQRSWCSNLTCYGIYMRECIFLCAHPFRLGSFNLDTLREFYLNEVLIHELAHHIDRSRQVNSKSKEDFADAFVRNRRS
jgi:hypothetical protein